MFTCSGACAPMVSRFALLACLVGACKPAAQSGRIAITADQKGFTPSSITVKKGAPATLVFTRTSDATCAKAVVFPALNVKKDLPLNEPVDVDVPTDAPRKLSFTCGMGMFEGSAVIQ